jgi:hypothetical protein
MRFRTKRFRRLRYVLAAGLSALLIVAPAAQALTVRVSKTGDDLRATVLTELERGAAFRVIDAADRFRCTVTNKGTVGMLSCTKPFVHTFCSLPVSPSVTLLLGSIISINPSTGRASEAQGTPHITIECR